MSNYINPADRYQFNLQQRASEAYLDGVDLENPNKVIEALIKGNNLSIDQTDGYLRFTQSEAEAFVERYQIIDYKPNDSTGLSYVILKDNDTGQYSLAVRSTEYKSQIQGGDWGRDGAPGADGEIFNTGFAWGQNLSLAQALDNIGAGISASGQATEEMAALKDFLDNGGKLI